MSPYDPDLPCIAFEDGRRLAAGPLRAVAQALHARALLDPGAAGALVFDAATSRPVELDLRGSAAEVAARLAPPPRGPGRPKLGVVAREVTLLPRHWDWLATQPGGASVALRRMVDRAQREAGPADQRRAAQDATYRFMQAVAGDLPGYEAALRALYAGHAAGFSTAIAPWPADLQAHAAALATPALSPGSGGALPAKG